MNKTEKIKVQKIINKIQDDKFDENDIDNLLIKLRAYSNSFQIFREFSDFVAHNNIRNKGITNDSIEFMYLRFKLMVEYTFQERKLNLDTPSPIWIKKLIKYSVNDFEDEFFIRKYGVPKKDLIKEIDRSFIINHKKGVVNFKNKHPTTNMVNAITDAMSIINCNPIYTQEKLISEIIGVIEQNNLIINKKIFKEKSEKITLCLLLLLHDAKFSYKGIEFGYCMISHFDFDKYKNYNTDQIENYPHKLGLTGHTIHEYKGRGSELQFCIMETNLYVEKWCDKNLLKLVPLEYNPKYKISRLSKGCDLALSNEFKLYELK